MQSRSDGCIPHTFLRITSSASALSVVQSSSAEVDSYMLNEESSPGSLNGLLGRFWGKFVERMWELSNFG